MDWIQVGFRNSGIQVSDWIGLDSGILVWIGLESGFRIQDSGLDWIGLGVWGVGKDVGLGWMVGLVGGVIGLLERGNLDLSGGFKA